MKLSAAGLVGGGSKSQLAIRKVVGSELRRDPAWDSDASAVQSSSNPRFGDLLTFVRLPVSVVAIFKARIARAWSGERRNSQVIFALQVSTRMAKIRKT